jgi:hypothetical protein
MKTLYKLFFLAATFSALALATVKPAPEIDPTSATGALALLAGGLLIIRARYKSRVSAKNDSKKVL